ncbi:peptidase [Bacillus aerolatus]|uniref:Peptidase n=1 Tax=Bacillus aerolatus TaxID=2653354 RepID=A0A6I1FIB0_9BACI|nr:M67 family metallopeptidase [Bacillus aerolatus]KAB7705983.1 peptidase [Bacillus aerolatus]
MKSKAFGIPLSIYNEMVQHGLEELPYEACGILSGRVRKAETIWKLENEKKSRNRYFVGEATVSAVLNKINGNGEMPIAIYHTHPAAEAIPSHIDIEFHPHPDVYMIIISYQQKTPVARCFFVAEKKYQELALRII